MYDEISINLNVLTIMKKLELASLYIALMGVIIMIASIVVDAIVQGSEYTALSFAIGSVLLMVSLILIEIEN